MSYKTEVIEALEVYKRNTAHVLGGDSDMVRAIDRCIALATEIKEDGWTLVTEALPELVNVYDEAISSDNVLCIDTEGTPVVCALWNDGFFCDEYGDKRDVVKWMEIPKEDGKDQWFDDMAKISALPSAQPEIIRCGECRYYRECEIFGKKITLCKRREYDSMYTEPDDFCSRAERREE